MCGFYCIHPEMIPFHELHKYDGTRVITDAPVTQQSALPMGKTKTQREVGSQII